MLPFKADVVRRQAVQHLEDLPGWANTVVGDLLSEVTHLDERITQYDQHIRSMACQSTAAQQLLQLSGVAETSATATISTVGNGYDFACGGQFCAWLGWVPGQYSSGGKARLGRITKAGDPYLRSLLVLGARSVLALAMRQDKPKQDLLSRRARGLAERLGDISTDGRAIVAIAAQDMRACPGRCSCMVRGSRCQLDGAHPQR